MISEKSGQTAGPLRLLIVDDEAAIRHIFDTGLTHQGCLVETAASGREALQTLMQQAFDVLVVDLRMQGMDGIVFLQEALKIWPWLGVVIVSGYVNEEAIEKARKLGVTRILQKPVSLQVLHDTIRQESEERREEGVDIPRGTALALMRDHLKLLTRLDKKTIGTDTLVGARLDFGKALAEMLPSDVVGILVLEDDENALLLASQRSVGRKFLDRVQDEMLTRYKALSGNDITPESLNIQMDGEPSKTDVSGEIGSALSVPVILGRDVAGILSLATVEAGAYTPADVSLLYHAANHISAVFLALRRMHHLATRDPLTGVYNRIRFEEELSQAWNVSRRYGYSMGVAIVDVDFFKTLNDSYGHSMGDQILCEFAGIMQQVARASDVISRYGGDEFVAILPQAEESDVQAFGERLLEQTREHVFCEDSYRLHLTVSVGIATSLNPTAPATAAAVLSQADRALYVAKRAGRNRLCIWPGSTDKPDESIVRPKASGKATARKADQQDGGGHIVVVDDEPAVIKLVGIMLERSGHTVTTFSSAEEAIKTIEQDPTRYDIVLTDLGLPEKGGIELLHEVNDIDDSIVKVVMTGYASVDNAVKSLREGAYDFIQKPLEQDQLAALIHRALEYRYLRIENKRYQVHLEKMVEKRSAQLANSLEEVRNSYQFTLEALVAMLDAREHQTGRHSTRVRDLALALATEMGIKGETLENIASGALLHDIGKIGIPDMILFRPGPLLPDEWTVMQTHSEIGHRFLQASPQLREASRMVLQHHERYDGDGYPSGLKAKEICIGARVFAVVDAYDAMRSTRVYRKQVTAAQAAEEVRRNSGKQFDPEVVKAFLNCHVELEKILSAVEEK